MMNLTALLLVLTLTGTPAAGVACVAECREATATSSHCHEDTTAADGPMVAASVSCYDPSVAESPYVIEQRALVDAAILTATASLAPPAMLWASVPTAPRGRAAACVKPPQVLRI